MDLSRIGASWISRLIRPQSLASGLESRATERVGAGGRAGRGGDRVSLASVDDQLARLRELVAGARGNAGDGRGVDLARRDVRGLLRSINGAISATGPGGGGPGYSVEGVSEAVAQVRVRGVELEPGERLDVTVEVLLSAQTGALYLSLGGSSLNLNGAVGSAFTIEIEGTRGVQTLEFSSGQTLGSIVAAVNTFSAETGVHATAGSTGVTLRSAEYGNEEFVSVRVLEDAGIGTSHNIGIYGFQADDNLSVDATSHQDYMPSITPNARDTGKDIFFRINGEFALSNGLQGFVSLPQGPDINIDLRAFFQGTSDPAQGYGFQRGTPFTAFTLVGTETGGAVAVGPESDRLDVRI